MSMKITVSWAITVQYDDIAHPLGALKVHIKRLLDCLDTAKKYRMGPPVVMFVGL